MYLGMFIVSWDGVDCVDWEVWFLLLEPWDCLLGDPHVTALYMLSLTAKFHNTLYTLLYGIITYHYNTIVQYFLFVLKKAEFNMEKEGREALKIGSKKKYQKDGKEKKAYLFLWPIIFAITVLI